MCQFFSCISNGQGKMFYFNAKIRNDILFDELNYEIDSHTSIAHYFEKDEDKHNKYEFNPLTKQFIIDQLNTKDDSKCIKRQLLKLDFKTIVPSLIIKEIINPFNIQPTKVTPEIINLLHKWDSVENSVGNSVGNSVRDSVRDSVENSVRDSVRDSVENSVWGYIASFFNITSWKYAENLGTNPWESVQKLWELGFVPSFDGTTWRLHSGKNAEIVYEWKK
jgi:hypothetical protein